MPLELFFVNDSIEFEIKHLDICLLFQIEGGNDGRCGNSSPGITVKDLLK